MFYLFSSDFRTKWKADVLDIVCYPEGQIFRFRYQLKHVSQETQAWFTKKSLPEKLSERTAVLVYAETIGNIPTRTFNFYPLRQAEVIRIQVIGTVYYVDIRLGKFIDYFSSGRDKADEILTTLREAIRQVKFYPLPPLTRMQDAQEEERREGLTWKDNDTPVPYQETPGFSNQGYFFQYLTDKSTGTMSYSIAASGSHKAWESVVEVLSAAPSMHRSIFYLVEGFYALRKKHFDLFGEYEEHLISPKDNGWDTRYPLKMGKSVVLKLLFYRSSKATALPPCSLEIKTDGDAFAGFSQKEIPVLSRYNEERVLIACKRVFDSIFAPIIIELKQEVALERNVSESASLLRSTQVATPWGLLEFRMKENAPQPQKSEAIGQELLAPNPFLLTQVVAPGKVS